MSPLCARAPGKLNLTLDVLSRRPDGYHELEMVMVSVSLHDRVCIYLDTGRPWELTCSDPGIPTGPENLCWKAARLYLDTFGLRPDGVRIDIYKRIPAQAGMAGGSADAAAVLQLLNRHYGCCSASRLRELGLAVGSDVPYCLFGGTALARGRGEVLQRLPDLPAQTGIVLVKPEFSLSTPALFRQLDQEGVQLRPDTPAMCRALGQGDLPAVGRLLANAFQPVAAARFPQVEQIRRALLDQGALGASLTGTGSVIFGLFADADRAAAAARALQGIAPLVEACTVLS